VVVVVVLLQSYCVLALVLPHVLLRHFL